MTDAIQALAAAVGATLTPGDQLVAFELRGEGGDFYETASGQRIPVASAEAWALVDRIAGFLDLQGRRPSCGIRFELRALSNAPTTRKFFMLAGPASEPFEMTETEK